MRRVIFFLIIGMIFTSPALSWAKEKPLPKFRITGYIEKVDTDSIRIFVPRMKQSLALLLAKDVRITDFAEPDSQRLYSLKDLKEKDLAICEGVIAPEGFICSAISFVHQNTTP